MASFSATSVTFCSSLKQSVGLGTHQTINWAGFGPRSLMKHLTTLPTQVFGRTSSVKFMSENRFPSLRSRRFGICCAAKPETVQKVCEIVRKQLALSADTELTPGSKFTALGADSLDTVEIVMELEEAFGISVEEENSQNITTVQEAADLIEGLVQKKGEA